MKRPLRLFALAVMVLGLVASFTPAGAQAPTPPPWSNGSVQPTAIIGSGSDTTYFLMNDLGTAYNESEGCELVPVNYPETGTEHQCRPVAQQAAGTVDTENYDHDLAIGYFPQGSNAGRRQLCSQTTPRPAGVPFITYARSSSAPDVGFQCPATPGGALPSNAGLKLRFVAFAKDALTWTYWTGQSPAPVTDLTQAQLNDIFVDCTITNWNQIGGENQPITVWAAIPGSGSRSTWDAFVGGSSSNCIPAEYKDGDNSTPVACPGERVVREHVMTPVKNDPCVPDEKHSIYYTGVGTYNARVDFRGDALLGSVEGFQATEANIQSGDFPFSRFMYNVIRIAGPAPLVNPQTAGFVGTTGWICKPGNEHAKPIGSSGAGTERLKASFNYDELVLQQFADNGFIPIRSGATQNKCDFVDVTSV